MGSHSSSDPPGNNGGIRRGQLMQHRQVRLSVRLKITGYHSSNVFNNMYVSTLDILENRKKVT